MATILAATLLGLVIGLAGTLCGGLLVFAWRDPAKRDQALLLGLSGGIMLAVVLFDLWPEAWHEGGALFSAIGTSVGVLLIGFFDRIMPALSRAGGKPYGKMAMVGLLIGLGIGTHNFPEGVALGTAYAAASGLGGWLELALLMGLHNIPEGVIMAATLRLGHVRRRKVLAALILVELPMALGAAVGGFFGRLSAPAVATALAFAGGAMFYVVCKELLPTGAELGGKAPVWLGVALGMVLGFGLTRIV